MTAPRDPRRDPLCVRCLCSVCLIVLVLGAPASGQEEAPAESPLAEPVSAEEAEAFALRLEASVFDGDEAAVRRSFDWRGIVRRADPGGWDDQEHREEVLSGFTEGVARGVAQQLIGSVEQGGSFSPLDAWNRDGESRIIFRLLSEDGVNYLEMTLGRNGDRVVIKRVYPYLIAESLSTCYTRLLAAMKPQREGAAAWLFGKDVRLRALANTVTRMNAAINEGRPGDAITRFRRLPESLRNEPCLTLIRLKAALKTGDDNEYREAIEATLTAFDGRRELDLLLVDAHALRGEYDEALGCLERLDVVIGGDPYLNVLRAGVHAQRDDLPEALRYARVAVREAGELLECHWMLIEVQLLLADHAGVSESLDRVEADHGVGFEDLREVEGYEAFCASPEGQRWLADHGFE